MNSTQPSGPKKVTIEEPPKEEPPKEEPFIEEVDEAKLIEERRKKREAIKAKYRLQNMQKDSAAATPATPGTPASPASPRPEESAPAPAPTEPKPEKPMVNPTVKAVQESDSAPPSPSIGSREDSPSTFEIAKEPAEKGEGGEDGEPSAADYDPVRDMEEDQRRNEQRLHDQEFSAADFQERDSENDMLMPEAKEEAQEGDDDFDMFAEGDDDDDMFAAKPNKLDKPNNVGKAVNLVAQGKQINVNLLDNSDDPEGYYRVILAEMLDDRYHVQANLGKGSFASVIRCFDTKTKQLVAIKMIRNNETLLVHPFLMLGECIG